MASRVLLSHRIFLSFGFFGCGKDLSGVLQFGEFCLDMGWMCLVGYRAGEFVYHMEEMDLYYLFFLFVLTYTPYISCQCMFFD